MELMTVGVTSLLVSVIILFFMMGIVIPRIKDILTADKELRRAENDEIKTDLADKKDAIEGLIKQINDHLYKSSEKLEKAERERIGSFSGLANELKNQQKITEQLNVTAQGLNKLLSNNQLRGQFGEKVAEELLKMNGFVKGTDYVYNRQLSESENRPDYTIFLPNKVKINVDCKFPYKNLQRMTEVEGEAKKEYVRLFEKDVREKIKQVISRDYINPEDNTVDFVILFIPNEMIFSYIYDKMNEVWSQAMEKKVVMAGPFSFTAVLRLVRQAYDNFRYQKNVQKIIVQIKAFEVEFDKYNEEFLKIGDRIKSLSDQYSQVDKTRTRQLLKSIDKIKQEDESPHMLPLAAEPLQDRIKS